MKTLMLILGFFSTLSLADSSLSTQAKLTICESILKEVKDYDSYFTIESCLQGKFIILSKYSIPHANVDEYEIGLLTPSEICSVRLLQSPSDIVAEVNNCLFSI